MNTYTLLHPKDRKRLEKLIVNTPHGILITGPHGSGKSRFALTLLDELRNSGYDINESVFDAENGFGIDNIRQLWQKLSYKPSPGNRIAVVVFKNAHKLKQEAQTALLKTLEEPPKSTLLIVLARSSFSMLPTITSRLTHIDLSPPLLEQYRNYFSEVDDAAVEHHYRITGGWFNRMKGLASKDGVSSYGQYVEEVKRILSMPILQRLIEADRLLKDASLDLAIFLETYTQVCWSAARSTIASQQGVVSRNVPLPWIHRSILGIRALEDYHKGGNKKILLTDLFLGI